MFAAIRLILIVVILAVLAGGAWYVTGMRAQLAVSEANNKKLEDAVTAQHSLIDQIKKDVSLVQEANQKLNTTIQAQNKDLNSLQNRFNTNADGSQRDIGKIAVANPSGIERAINRGTVNAIRCLEIASGAPLTPEERNAKTPSEINKECPAIANPNYKP
jgi:cell division protein FtsB